MFKKTLRGGILLALCVLLLLGSSTSAYAYYNDEESNDGVTVDEVTTTPEPSPVEQEPAPVQEPQGQITPDGNLSLLDDLDYSARGGLQFMTVTTRSGHVYYIVIDRTANSQNVYFLNQVDEYDLMSIMSDAEKAQYESLRHFPPLVNAVNGIILGKHSIHIPQPESCTFDISCIQSGNDNHRLLAFAKTNIINDYIVIDCNETFMYSHNYTSI